MAGSSVVEPVRKPVVLIVDDENENLRAFARSFRKELDVKTASSGPAAIDMLAAEPVDMVITDYTMPAMNGVQVLSIAAEKWPHVKRLIISGHTDLAELHSAHRLGLAAELLPKPFRKADVLATIERLLGTP